MKKDVIIKLEKEKERRLRELPDFIADFIVGMDAEKSIRTQIALAKDYTVFLEYLLTLPDFSNKTSISEFTIEDMNKLKERNIRDFLNYLTSYKKTFLKKNNKEYTQVFTNDQKGKARKLASLHSLWDWLIREEYVIKDITKKIEIKLTETKQIKNKLEAEDIDRFTETIINDVNVETQRGLKFHDRVKFRDLTMLLLLAFTGIRISELVQLDINDISIKDGAMIVIRKGGNQDKIYIPDEILSTLAKYIEKRKQVTNIEAEYKDALFLSSQKKRIDPRTVRYMINKYKKRAGIDIKVTPHTFRRSFAMKMYNLTGDIQLTADYLGHTTTETTRKFYAEPDEERKRKIMKEFRYSEK